MSDSIPDVSQSVRGDRNIFTGTGDILYIRHPAFIPLEEIRTRAELHVLLKRVKNIWIEGVLEKSIINTVLIDLGKRLQPEAIDHPWGMVLQFPNRPVLSLSPKIKTAEIFEENNQAMLILGEPGSGKTITLL